MQSLPISSANAANTWWYGNNHTSGTTDPNDPLKWVPNLSGMTVWPIIHTTVGTGVLNTNTVNTVLNARMYNLQPIKYTLSYENFKRAYHKFDGYVFLMENSIDGTIQYLSLNTIMALIYRFYGDSQKLPFPMADSELTIWYRMPNSPEDQGHIFEVEEDELKMHYKVLSES